LTTLLSWRVGFLLEAASSGGRTALASDLFVNAIERAARRIAPAKASPTDRPKEEIAELTPAASPARCSEIGASV
jgi:hypothetical protein